jgi:hypothetical protein
MKKLVSWNSLKKDRTLNQRRKTATDPIMNGICPFSLSIPVRTRIEKLITEIEEKISRKFMITPAD